VVESNRAKLVLALVTAGLVIGAGILLYDRIIVGAPEEVGPERLALGRRVYDEHCAACHGTELEGQPNWRQRNLDGFLPAPPHDETGHTWHHPDQQLFAMTKYGTAALIGSDYKTVMVGFGEVLSDEDIRAVLAYIKSRWPENVRRRQAEITARAARAE
jgi:mono/diheme cytochrome c family protein